MNVNATTENSNMKISRQSSNDVHRPRPQFVRVSIFETSDFPVPVRNLRLAHGTVSKTSLETGSFKIRGIPQRQWQGEINPINVTSKSLDTARHIQTFL
jgi:hypothetical protein